MVFYLKLTRVCIGDTLIINQIVKRILLSKYISSHVNGDRYVVFAGEWS